MFHYNDILCPRLETKAKASVAVKFAPNFLEIQVSYGTAVRSSRTEEIKTFRSAHYGTERAMIQIRLASWHSLSGRVKCYGGSNPIKMPSHILKRKRKQQRNNSDKFRVSPLVSWDDRGTLAKSQCLRACALSISELLVAMAAVPAGGSICESKHHDTFLFAIADNRPSGVLFGG